MLRFLATCIFLSRQGLAAPLSFALSYGNHMVLQQAPARANVWGFTDSNASALLDLVGGTLQETVPVTLMPYNETAYTWHALLPPVPASVDEEGVATNYTITASVGDDAVSITDVLFGEVWVCSGQSNMAFLLEMAFNGSALVQDANDHPELRFMTVQKTTSSVPLRELTEPIPLPWAISNNVSVSDDGKAIQANVGDDNWLYMSAVCYLFGLNIHLARRVPVGLMNSNWGGTAIQDWSSAEAMAQCSTWSNDHFATEIGTQLTSGVGVSTHLFNAMISPLLNHTIKGVIWYQGEANGGSPVQYGCQQPALVADWRAKWHVASSGQTSLDFPFGVCEIAPVISHDGMGATGIRWFQTGSPSKGAAFGHLPNAVMPNTFMAVTIDLGDAASPYGSVHPRHKVEVAERLALAGRKVAYGEDVYAGPVFDHAAESDGEVTLFFNDTGKAGLELTRMNITTARDQGSWTGDTPFEVCVPTGSKVDVTCLGAGALPLGGDLLVADNITVADARSFCLRNSSCVGFTLQAPSCDAGLAGKVYFKRVASGPNRDKGWMTFQKVENNCGALSRYDGWAPASSVRVGRGGDSIILGLPKGQAMAVRYAWRAYPCEYRGCGVYSKAEQLPPPPFWALVGKKPQGIVV